MGLSYHLAGKMDEQFPLIADGNCIFNARAQLYSPGTTFMDGTNDDFQERAY